MSTLPAKNRGILFHAKHAFMPNSLGYCGPDDRGTILQHLEESRGGEELARTLEGFEAAFPFLKLIARETGRNVFDYSVPEAYWIGNSLLDRVPVPEFYEFSHRELQGKDRSEVKKVFKELDGAARPHHTFYVMNTYATLSAKDGPNLANESQKRVAQLIDNCRISWGRVVGVDERTLQVEYRPVAFDRGKLVMARAKTKRVRYNSQVKPFAEVVPGDAVSLHWDYACDVLTRRQLRNITKYTEADILSANSVLSHKRTTS